MKERLFVTMSENSDNPSNKKLSVKDALTMDKIDELPLSIIPLKSSTLKKAKLLKNSKLETVVELYNDPTSGSFQVPTDEKMTESLGIDGSEAAEHDKLIIQQLSQLDSFDIYSMRSSLQRVGLDLDIGEDVLQLSPDMKKALRHYASAFTTPLLKKIYGLDTQGMDQLGGDLNKLFQNPDKDLVLKNLMKLAENTGIPLGEIPAFIKNYSDVFQSVSYYSYSYDAIRQDSDRFLLWIQDVIDHKDIVNTPQTRKICLQVNRNMTFVLQSLRERFDLFRQSFEVFWSDINAESFVQLRREVMENYESIGHVLCAVVVKINAWREEFPFNDVGSPNHRAKFAMTELAPGIADVRKTEEDAREALGMERTISK